MNRYQLINLLKENEEAFENLKADCIESISESTRNNVILSIQSILENAFDVNVSRETCDKIRYRIVEESEE